MLERIGVAGGGLVRRWFYGCLVAIPFAMGVLGYSIVAYVLCHWVAAPLFGWHEMEAWEWVWFSAWIWVPLGIYGGGEALSNRGNLSEMFGPRPTSDKFV